MNDDMKSVMDHVSSIGKTEYRAYEIIRSSFESGKVLALRSIRADTLRLVARSADMVPIGWIQMGSTALRGSQTRRMGLSEVIYITPQEGRIYEK